MARKASEGIMASTAQSVSDGGLGNILTEVAREKGIERKVLVETIEAAIHKAAQSVFGPTRELEARFNDESGHVDLFQYMTVLEAVTDPEREISMQDVQRHKLDAELGEELGFQVFWRPEDADKAREQDKEYGDLLQLKQGRTTFGRIAAQTAKQVLMQRVRDAERDMVFNEFKDRRGELIRGIVRRFERGNNIIVDLSRTEGILPFREQTPRETYRPGDRIVAYVKNLDREARGPQVILSRSDPRLVEKLFEAEVPEIYEGIVRIVAVAREAGSRSKIAVTSRDSDVDPVGACVGMKGSRVQAVVQELRGEKIDIVPYDPDPARYVIAAIAPAAVHKVIVDEAGGRMELVVPDEKLSLAIGRKGQNVRLAAQLIGWKLDIVSESKFKQMEAQAFKSLQQLDGITDTLARAMHQVGFRALEELLEAPLEELAAIPGIDTVEGAEAIQASARETMETVRMRTLSELGQRSEPITDRDRLMLIRGVGEHTALVLEEAGYRTVEDILDEDSDKLALRTGFSNSRVARLLEASEQYMKQHHAIVEAAALRIAEVLRREAEAAAASAEPREAQAGL